MLRTALLALPLIACGGPPPPDGGGIDAPTPPEDTGIDAPLDTPDGGESCLGMPEGYTVCALGSRSCCGGVWHHYIDGACLPGMDAGVPPDAGSPCTADPEWIGCPCATEGAIACPRFRYRRLCTAGAWAEDRGIVCCSNVVP